ncbi:MAG TPA: hypothetical protein PKM34_11045 [Bacteroidales bacterium]|jgi:hypothetical protein|nr:hypothetical protein [Bacteroidales bacterium]MDX9907299.1 hypothetical protein [Bacteroidales bacterium]HNQ84172.1 hypothetical protein [Bacteroidales bacterium]HPI85608.1 hypothetical protein [Bacteroidales bacterium]
MGLNKGKHIVGEVDGVRCTIVESGISKERAAFLKELLEFNGYEVRIQEINADPPDDTKTFTLGVTDIVFNPVIAVYQKTLKRKDGKKVTPAFWNQTGIGEGLPYWLVGRA